MILITFVQDQREELLSRLEKYFKNSDAKMTRERYFKMCEQLGQEPNENENKNEDESPYVIGEEAPAQGVPSYEAVYRSMKVTKSDVSRFGMH